MSTTDTIAISIFGLNLVLSLRGFWRLRSPGLRRSSLRSILLSVALIILVVTVDMHPSPTVHDWVMRLIWSLLVLSLSTYVLDWRERVATEAARPRERPVA